jgi:predicted Zn-dependent protease
MTTQQVLIAGIMALGLLGGTIVSLRFQQPKTLSHSTVNQVKIANQPFVSSSLSTPPPDTPVINELKHPDPVLDNDQSHSPSVVLPADDGTHYVHAIKLPYSVWDSTHQTIAVYIDPRYPQYLPEVKQAFIAWQQALNSMFAFTFVPDANQSDVAITWADSLPQDERHPDNVYTTGLTHSTSNQLFIFRNDIEFRVKTPAQQPIAPGDLYNTALHEIGHMLGIKGHSDSPADIMTPVSHDDGHRRLVTHRDVNTLRYLYQTMVNAPRILTPPNVRLAVFRQHVQLMDMAYNQHKSIPQAMVTIQQAIALYPSNPEAQLVLANLQLRQDHYMAAKGTLAPWLKQPHAMHTAMFSKYVIAHILQAKAYARENRQAQARQEAKTALPKLTQALRLPDLDITTRQYLQEAQPVLKTLADQTA